MPWVLFLGLAAVLIIIGAGIALVGGGGQTVDSRLQDFVGTTPLEVPEEKEEAQRTDVADRVDRLLSGQNFFDPIKGRIAKADVKLRVSEYIILVFLSAIGVSAVAYWFFNGNIIMAIIGFIFGLRLPGIYVNTAASRRMQAFDSQLGDTLNMWVNALRSGYSVLQSMEAIATEMPAPISKEFERVVQEVRLGLNMNQALSNMYRRVPSEDLDLVITAVNIQREVGGNLAEILDIISFTIRERVRIKGEIRTLTAQGRISGTVISLLPIGLGLILYAINPEYMQQLWINEAPYILPNIFPCGWLVLGIGGFMIAMGVVAIRKIVDVQV